MIHGHDEVVVPAPSITPIAIRSGSRSRSLAALAACSASSVMPLAVATGDDLHYMDIAVETKGYIYTLFRKGTSEFFLQIYTPEGHALTEPQTGVNAAKLTVNQWRTMFTLNFETVLGPGQRTEPGISEWIPSTPAGPSSGS
jgi:hypothetical protein